MENSFYLKNNCTDSKVMANLPSIAFEYSKPVTEHNGEKSLLGATPSTFLSLSPLCPQVLLQASTSSLAVPG